jgi:hypothetical protein
MRIFFFLLLLATIAQAASPCGFSRLRDYLKNPLAGRSVALSSTTCQAEALYDSVFVHTTSHFRIYYAQTGPHKVLGASAATGRPAYVDTLAKALEAAWKNHTEALGMRPPKPMARTTHYQRSDYPELYPVEIIELTLLRNTDYIMGGPCQGCYGLSYPGDASDPEATELLIDNDFLYASDTDTEIEVQGGTCSYTNAETPLVSNGVDYHAQWPKALRVTANHELYHGVQLRYLDFRKHDSFWFEASATGVEEIGASDVNDYWQYLDAVFSQPGTPVTANRSLLPYGQATLYLFLHSALGPLFDAALWQGFSDYPSQSFPAQLERVASALGLDAETVFHAYATAMFFSGSRSQYDAQTSFAADRASWPSWSVHSFTSSVSLESASFDYIRQPTGKISSMENFSGKASLVQWNKSGGQSARLYALENALDSSAALAATSDSSVLVISSLLQSNTQDNAAATPLRAWPNPWNGDASACFGPLPATARGIEIRSADGLLLVRLPRSDENICWDGRIQGKKIAPGVLHWRVLPHGKNHTLLVIF